jgi:hypothetical protein
MNGDECYYQPGDAVVATQAIQVGPVCIPAGTAGVVEWAYPHVCRVQFVGFLALSNVPTDWLCKVRLAVIGEATV